MSNIVFQQITDPNEWFSARSTEISGPFLFMKAIINFKSRINSKSSLIPKNRNRIELWDRKRFTLIYSIMHLRCYGTQNPQFCIYLSSGIYCICFKYTKDQPKAKSLSFIFEYENINLLVWELSLVQWINPWWLHILHIYTGQWIISGWTQLIIMHTRQRVIAGWLQKFFYADKEHESEVQSLQ